MAQKKNRDFMVIATKFTSNFKLEKDGKGKTVNHAGNHRRSLHVSLRDSLKKLQTDYIDILYLHWWDWTTGIEGKSKIGTWEESTNCLQRSWILLMLL